MDIQKVKIVDLNADYAVVLTDSGAFKRVVRKADMTVGGGIYVTDQDHYIKARISQSFKLSLFNKRLLQVTGIMALLIAILITQSFTPMSYAVISVDINPSIQLFIDADYSVVKIKSMNADGKKLLSEYDFIKKKSASSVITELFTLAAEMEYLKSDQNEILIAAAIYNPSKDDKNTLQLSNDVDMLIDAVLSEVDYSIFGQENVVINAVASNAKNIEAAEKEHLSIGQYEKDYHSDAVKPYAIVEDGKQIKTHIENATTPEDSTPENTTDKGLDDHGKGKDDGFGNHDDKYDFNNHNDTNQINDNSNNNSNKNEHGRDNSNSNNDNSNNSNSNSNSNSNNDNSNNSNSNSNNSNDNANNTDSNMDNSNHNNSNDKNSEKKIRHNFSIDNIKSNVKNNIFFGNDNDHIENNDRNYDKSDDSDKSRDFGRDGSKH